MGKIKKVITREQQEKQQQEREQQRQEREFRQSWLQDAPASVAALGQQLGQERLARLQLQRVNDQMGQELVQMKLRSLGGMAK